MHGTQQCSYVPIHAKEAHALCFDLQRISFAFLEIISRMETAKAPTSISRFIKKEWLAMS